MQQARISRRGGAQTRPRRHENNPFKGGIPRTLSTQLKLNAVYAPTALSSGAPNGYTRWNPNDMYDPLYDAGGGQSMFRDQLYALYHWARVKSFRFKVVVWSDSVYPVMLALIPKQDSSATTYVIAAEQPGARTGVVSVYQPCTLAMSGNVDSFLENAPGTWAIDDTFKQATGSALAAQAATNVHLYYYYPSSSGTANLTVQYVIEQDAVFSEVIAQAQS